MSIITMVRRDTRVTLIWNESAGIAIHNKLARGMSRAVRIYLFALKRKLGEWGSLFITSALRFRARHSAPGTSPPLKQTGNLEKSIRTDISLVGPVGFFGQDIEGIIWTDVPYAPTLEKGTPQVQVDQSTKKHTRVRLWNPIKILINIVPRPAWLPIFEETKQKMINTIRRG